MRALETGERRGQVLAQLLAEIATLLHDERGQAEPRDGGTDASESRRGDGEALERIALIGVEAEGDHNGVSPEIHDPLQRPLQRSEVVVIAGLARQRQVEVVPDATPRAAFGRMAPEERIEPFGIGMDRDGQYVVAIVENALRAVAVMHVDIEDRRAQARHTQPFGCDGSVVEKAEPPGQIAEGMMPRRAAEGVDSARALGQEIGTGDGALSRPIGGLPRARAYGTGGIGLMIARLSDGGFRIAIAARGGVDVGDHLRPAPLDALPAGVDIAQEGYILRRMNRRDGAKPGIIGRDHFATRRARALGQPRDTLGLFRAGLDNAIGHEMLRRVLPLAVVENGLHLPSPFSLSNPARGRRICVTRSCAAKPRPPQNRREAVLWP